MKLKIWLWLSCLCVLTTLSVCISVYAYNAYATKSVSTNMVIMSGNSNNSNLDDGYMTAYARVGTYSGLFNEFFSTQEYDYGIVRGGSVSLTGYGSGFVMGYDSNGKRHSKFDDKKHGYDD